MSRRGSGLIFASRPEKMYPYGPVSPKWTVCSTVKCVKTADVDPVYIAGGSSGIGYALAAEFYADPKGQTGFPRVFQ